MPELPEVHTTVEGLKKMIVGKTIKDVWSDFHVGTAHGHRNNLKNKKHYEHFRKIAKGVKIKSVERRGKNVLINLGNGYTIVVHMKMTGHLMVGKYKRVAKNGTRDTRKEKWMPMEKGPLQDWYNKFIHFVAGLSNNKCLVLSDMRKFASVCLVKTAKLNEHEGLKDLGKDALKINLKEFVEKIKAKKNWPIKSALLDQSVVAGIGNIYSDEILYEAGLHSLSAVSKVPDEKISQMFKAMKRILLFSISKGGDSKSDYRNIWGEKGGFQNFHNAYGRKGEKCKKINCRGIIERKVIRGRSAHFCPKHQKYYG